MSSCKPDDQTSIKKEHLIIADPAPVSTDGTVERFKKNNDQHKILIGVFDTGVDYNHPFLKDHMHFDLDEKGVPSGLGIDFLTLEDKWASHRAIATSRYTYEFLSDRQKEDALNEYKTIEEHDNTVRRSKMGYVCAVETLIKTDPRLAKYAHPYRDMRTEIDDLTHGTHVSGLASYDNPAIGIIPYRLLPYHQSKKDEADETSGKVDKFVTNLERAVVHAEERGVKIVNLSLGGSYEAPENSNDASFERDQEKFENYKRLLTEGVEKLVKNHSKILFVAAAANSQKWSDNETLLQYPCGVEAPNILCVGALRKNGGLAKFTNLPINQIALVFASGSKILSTIPSDQCGYLQKQFSSFLASGRSWEGMCRYDLKKKQWAPDDVFIEKWRKPVIDTIYDVCAREKLLFETMSGTSMATPIVAHMAAERWLANPKLTPAELIADLQANSSVDKRRQFPIYKLTAKRPSWYRMFEANKTTSGDEEPVPDKHFVEKPEIGKTSSKSDAATAAMGGAIGGFFEFVQGSKAP